MRYLIIIAGLILGIVPAAHAQSDTDAAFGLRFNEPLTLPKCSTKNEYKAARKTSQTCYIPDGHGIDYPGDLWMNIVFPAAKAPVMLSKASFRAVYRDGKLVRIQILTNGQATQDRDLQALVEKYGEPTVITRPQYQNGYGMKSTGIQASWELPSGLHVQMVSPFMIGTLSTSTRSFGQVVIETAEMKAQADAAEKAKAAQHTQL